MNPDTHTSLKITINGMELGKCSSLEWSDSVSAEDSSSVNVCNSYQFKCDVFIPNDLDGSKKRWFQRSKGWNDAVRLADRLNDLVEEYHAPGVPRRERRSIKREFDKVFRIFCKHCKENYIQFTCTKG